MTRFECYVTGCGVDALTIVPSPIIGTCVEDITIGLGRGLLLVLGCAPREMYLVGTCKVDGKGVYGERLYGLLGVVHFSDVSQYTFIYSS